MGVCITLLILHRLAAWNNLLRNEQRPPDYVVKAGYAPFGQYARYGGLEYLRRQYKFLTRNVVLC